MALPNKRTYKDLGLNEFLSNEIEGTSRFTPGQVAATFPTSSLKSSRITTAQLFTTTIGFSATDNDTAAWTQGVINFADGRKTETIAAGNTGDITATTYVYYDEAKKGSLQTDTDSKKAVGERKFMLAIVEKNADTSKLCKITPVNATGLTVNSIVANQIQGDQLDVLAAKTGTLDVDEEITVGNDANVKIDGANTRILINDGTNNRIVIGEV